MNKVERNFSRVMIVITIATSLFSGAATSLLLFYFYSSPRLGMLQQQLEIMEKSLEKNVQIVLTVVPAYDWSVSTSSDGYMKLTNTTLTISRTEPTEFKVYVSNVGAALAHLLYIATTVHGTSGWMFSGSVLDVQNIVLKPNDAHNVTYVFDPSIAPNYIHDVNFTFALMTAETIGYEIVRAEFQD